MTIKELRKKIIRFGPLNPYYIAQSRLLVNIYKHRRYASGVLLDVGCGDKRYLPLFSDTISRYIGLDLPRSGEDADIIGSALSLPIKRGSVDTIICNEVLEHLPEPSLFFDEASFVLKEGGYMILSTPQVWGLHEVPYDYYRYTPYGLEYLAEKSGFEVISIKNTCGTFGMIGQRLNSFLFNRCNRNLLTKTLITPLIFVINLISTLFDKVFNYEGDTLDNIITVKKPGIGKYGN